MRVAVADERDLVDERVGYGGGRLLLATLEEVILDRDRLILEAVALGEAVVEVLAPGAHPADVERQHRLEEVAARVDVVAHHDGHEGREIPVRRAPAADRETLLERGAVHGRSTLGREEDREPAVGDLRRERDVLRADRGEVDRHLRPGGVDDDLQRPAETRRARAAVGDVVMLPVVLERRLAAEDRAHDLHVLPRPGERLAPRLAVPPLGDLRARGPEPEEHAAAGEDVQGGDRRRCCRGRASGHLHDRAADLDLLASSQRPMPSA